MLIVYKSNKLNVLLSIAQEIIEKKPLSNIFEKEIFVHDNKILFQYLNMFIAKKIGISSNFKLYCPHQFIWKLIQKFSTTKNIKNTFTHSIITWKIMKILHRKFFCKDIYKMENDIEKFKFSFLTAKIFEQYLLYRPDWINSWEAKKNILNMNEEEKWQIKLWEKIIDDNKKNNQPNYHFPNLFKTFSFFFHEKKLKKTDFPYRFFFISSFSINPSYIKILKKISLYTNIYFLYITPIKNNTFYIRNRLLLQKFLPLKKNIVDYSLIELWGKYEKIYYLCNIKSKDIKIVNCFKRNQGDKLLNNIQNNFLKKNIVRTNQITRKCLKLTDDSISINICFSIENEIEILHEKLLQFFLKNPTIKPNDIVVTSFALEKYIPYIKRIFKYPKKRKTIPFFICKKHSKITKIILSSFEKLLNLSQNRFKNKEILEFFDIPEIAQRFSISENEIDILYHWVEETNIRWGIDSRHKSYLSFPREKQNTWLYGIEKLLLSYAINDTKSIWNNILSCSLINGNRAELVGKLITFIKTLEKWQKKLSKLQHLIHWRLLSKDLINDFFCKSKRIEESIEIIQKNWLEMIDEGLFSQYSQKITIEILRKKFIYKTHSSRKKKFSSSSVNFCHPSTICYLPFKIICVIGADRTSILKKNYLENLNLLKKYPLINDVNSYEKDCYLFLQMITCAKEYFYISYVGYSKKNQSKIYPLILIDQLLDYIGSYFYLVGDKNLIIEDNIKKISKHLSKIYQKEYFYETKYVESSIIETSHKQSQEKNTETYNKKTKNQEKIHAIDLTDLIFFWKNPIRYFCNFHLKIKFNPRKQIMKTTEPFLVDKLDLFTIKSILLNSIINNQDTVKLFQYYMHSGKLPCGILGEISWDKILKEMTLIAKSVLKYRILTRYKKTSLQIKKYRINIFLSEIQETGLLRWKPAKINYHDQISLWLEHIVYSTLGGLGESKIIGYKNQNWSLRSLKTEVAYTYLVQYVEGYIKGRKKILLLTKSGASWLDQIYDVKNNYIRTNEEIKIKAHKKLLEIWMGNHYIKGEKEDFYIRQIITKLNSDNIKKICNTAKKWLVPMLKNRKID